MCLVLPERPRSCFGQLCKGATPWQQPHPVLSSQTDRQVGGPHKKRQTDNQRDRPTDKPDRQTNRQTDSESSR